MNRKVFATCLFVLAAGALGLSAVRPALFRQEAPAPLPQHERLIAESVGEWQGTMTAFMPDAPTEPTAATDVVTPIGGFWVQSRFECSFMGAPYLGTGVTGYDAEKKKYVGTWADNTSSQLAITEGEMDAKGEKLVMHWRAPDMTGAMTDHRSETVYTKDSYTTNFYMGKDSQEKTMVIAMKRKAKSGAK